ncbi:MAG TPA: site-specific integrase [Blastocatellia bacterium]|nr:site-specific integrase [Blastocatellia bacterium]
MTWATVQPTDFKMLSALYQQHIERFKLGQRRACWLRGLEMLLVWLQPQLDQTWQEVWELGERDDEGWRQLILSQTSNMDRTAVYKALQALIAYRLVRPSYRWLLEHNVGDLYNLLFDTDEAESRQQLLRASHELGITTGSMSNMWRLIGRVLAHTGRSLAEVTAADLLELRAAARETGHLLEGHFVATRLLYHLGILTEPLLSPAYFHTVRPTIEQLVDGFGIRNREVREVFVLYLKERAPSLDFTSLRQLAYRLVKLFWCDIEGHHPEATSLKLPPSTVADWKQRLRVLPNGKERLEVVAIFFHIRSFYLDILQWSQTNPEIWAKYASPCPIRESDLASHHKSTLRQKARAHARIRLMQPFLARFVDHVRSRREESSRLLEAALRCEEGEMFDLDGVQYERVKNGSTKNKYSGPVSAVIIKRANQFGTPRINCRMREDRAFWAWAITEVLRLTGLRCEELAELTHLSIRDHTPKEGQRTLLLQVAPSKQDRERVLPICPELAHVLARIVERVRGKAEAVPCIPRYDGLERTIGDPLPYLFQGGPKRHRGPFCREQFRELLRKASLEAGLRDKNGELIVFQAHDFRRLFATEVVSNGLPIHIAAKLLGHMSLNTTRGYVAVYEDEVVHHYQNHLARRRAYRPPYEYREPTDAEWTEFEQHFRHRRMALGDCYRPYGTDCPHEHACVRCPMLRMDPLQLPRLLEIEQDTFRLLNEARSEGWDGECAGLESTLVHIRDKRGQVERIEKINAGIAGSLNPYQSM